jgi:anti-anti-sigma factor
MTETLRPDHGPDSVRCVHASGELVIHLTGEVDMNSWSQLDKAFEAVVAAGPCPVTVDLSAATFVDSNTLGFLARLHEQVTATGHPLVLSSPTRIVARAIEVTGLDQVLTIRR